MRSAEAIRSLYETRKAKNAPWHSIMTQVRDLYNTELAVPLPELDQNEQAAVTNLLKKGIDGTAQRINSTLPDIHYPPMKPGQSRSEATADLCRRANLGWWQRTDMTTVMSERARHFLGYATSPVMLRPDPVLRQARWQVISPLNSYPSPPSWSNSCTPENIIYTYTRPVAWFRTHYPDATLRLRLNSKIETVTLCEYNDADETVLIALGHDQDPWQETYGAPEAELHRAPNKANMCLAVQPRGVSLDRPAGQFDGLIPMYFKQAKLDALEYIAIEQGVFPRTWLVGRQGEKPEIKHMADGRKGEVGIVLGGVIQEETLNPGYKTTQAIDRLAGEQRLEGNVPAEMQGVSAQNIRTGRRGEEVLANGIDYGIQEAQRAFEVSLREENRRAVAIAKGYFGSETHSFYVDWRGASGPVEFQPNTLFVSDHNTVKYSLAGADLNSQVIRSGQLLGAGIISKKTAREQNPEIKDADFEDHQIVVEMAQTAFLEGLAQQMASGAFNPMDAALFVKQIKTNKDPIEAFLEVQKQAQQRQATSGEPGTPEGPVPPTSPEAMPGIAPGAEAGIPIQEPAAPLNNLQAILQQAGTTRRAMTSPLGTA